MLAIFTVMFVIFLATEISQLTIMEYFVSSTAVKKVQAHYAAKSCLNISLLRIKGYQQATKALGNAIPDLSMVDMIWNFPLSWPPALPKELSSFDSSTIKKTVAGSLMKHQFLSTITAEGGKIDINDLGSPSEGLRNKTKKQILDRLTARVANGDDAFADRYANFNFNELINNIADWIDEGNESLNGGSEKSLYTDFRSDFIPPNRPLKTLEELHMISGMTDEIFALLAPEITLYGVKGVNINQAEKDVLLSLFSNYDPKISEELVSEILKRRSNPELGGPFKDEKEFVGFLAGYIDPQEFNNNEEKIPLFFGAEINFRISCIGVVGNMTNEIEAVVYDANGVKARLKDALKSDRPNDPNGNKCKDLQGDELFECLCEDEPNDSAKKKCIDKKKKEAQNPPNPDQGNAANAIQPGPPKMIFLRVK